jgi:NACHT domain
MQVRSKWLLPIGVFVIIVGVTSVLWWRSNVTAADTWWRDHGPALLRFVLPLLTALIVWACKQMIATRPERSTSEQLIAAQKALTGRGLEWWRGIPEPAWPAQPLRAGLRPLDVTWSKPLSGPSSPDKGPIHGSSGDIPGLIAQFRANYPCRLVIKGTAGSGKSVLARMIMAELLRNPEAGDPVPVFLPLWSWSPRDERLHDWMKRQIAQAYPELQDVATYGPTAVANLVDQGGVLPILDGLDVLPPRNREAVLADGALMAQDRLILTYRGADFDDANGFIVIEPESIGINEVPRFLCEATGLDATAFANIPKELTDPRIVCLANIVYKETGSAAQGGSVNGNATAPDATKQQLLKKLIPALMPASGDWAKLFPWYGTNAESWLRYLAGRDLRDPDNRADEFDPNEPGDSRIAWWNLYLAVPRLRARQALLRSAIVGFLAFVLIVLIYRNDLQIFQHVQHVKSIEYVRQLKQVQQVQQVKQVPDVMPWRYALLTAGAYGLMIFVAGACFGRENSASVPAPPFSGTGRFAVSSWWVKNKLKHWRLSLVAGSLGFILFGLMLGIRTAISSGIPIGTWTAIGDGILQGGILVILTHYIAQVPLPPRTTREVDRGYVHRYEFNSFLKAIVLGMAFGVLWGLNVVFKHQQHHIAPLHEDVLTGLVTGINFALGAWFFGWAQARFRSMSAPDPKAAARTDIVGMISCALILGVTFAFAFGINAPFQINGMSLAVWFVVGFALGILGSEWPIYVVTISWLALKERKLPFRLMRFLECCRVRGIIRSVGQEYQFHDDDLLEHLSGKPRQRQVLTPDAVPVPEKAALSAGQE